MSEAGSPASGPVAGQVKDAEISAEQSRVDAAYVRLDEMRTEAEHMLREGFRQSQAGTRSSLVDRDAMVYQASLRAQALNVADDGLVFGRLDLLPTPKTATSNGAGTAETEGPAEDVAAGSPGEGGEGKGAGENGPLYVGRVGVRTRDHESLVVDWRAPAAEAFYRATPEDPRGVIRRRVLHSRGHRVIDIEDDLLQPELADGLTVVGDGAFLASLARTREGAMRDIVATIQREQDVVIRAPADGTVIVRGGPGTGKTAVALHRVAYLLFHHRRRFGGRGVLIVGPNQRFTAYIERVLPSLGEGSAALRSLGDLVPGVVATRHDTPELSRIKGAGAMAGIMRRAVADHPPGAPELLTVVHAGVVVRLDRPRLDKIRRQLHQRVSGSVNTARRKVAETVLDALWDRFLEIGGLVDAPGIKRGEFIANARDQLGDFLTTWWPIRTPSDVLRALGDPERLRSAAGRDLSPAQVGRLAASFAREDDFSYQDVALLDEIDAILGRPPRAAGRVREDDPYVVDGVNILTGEEVADWEPEYRELSTSIERTERARRVDDEAEEATDFGHVVVDEAQDLSPMQWRMLGRRGRQATWTVVEDPAQSAWEDLDASRQAMAAALGIAETPSRGPTPGSGRGGQGRRGGRNRRGGAASRPRRPHHAFELTTNYRNSIEIADVATRVLAKAVPDAKPARAVRRTGHRAVIDLHSTADQPTLLHAARDAVVDLLGQVEGTIGVILPLGWPKETWDVPDRVQTLDVLEAKGLEFDAAVLVSPEEVATQTPTGLRTLYVAVSRATQRLTVVTADKSWKALLTTT
ncbi:HelD family protein [Actinocorallia sp. A-T 12471]|uniref:HelD family protein n=1 Tax=Actinocorallia sp. A-T 12471 TaxID=3089813 RepID=UPI0029D35BB2|nr:AAA family ATPase [Actinocorallia sp. A-T 12471]MDX6744655.1 AAA family ATPase [Actinocorallia sp. A-T 12471]